MNKGLTLIETIIAIIFISIMTFVLGYMIINTKEVINYSSSTIKIDNTIELFDKYLLRLIEEYDNNTWEFNETSIICNNQIILSYDQYDYYFYFTNGVVGNVKFNNNIELKYYNANLIGFDTLLNNQRIRKFYYVGGRIYAN